MKMRFTSKEGPGNRVFASLPWVFFMLVPLIFIGVMLAVLPDTLSTRSWTETPALVEISEVDLGGPESSSGVGDGEWRVRFAYQYEVDGTRYRGFRQHRDDSAVGPLLFSSHNDARAFTERFPTGSTQTAYVNPTDPSESVIEHEPLWILAFVALPLVFLTVGVLGLRSVWSAKKEKVSVLRRGKGASTKAMLFLMGLIFSLVGGVLFYFLGVRPAQELMDSQKWTPVPCEILSSMVRSHKGEDSTTYSVEIVYSYEFEGRDYTGDRWNFFGGSSSGYASKEAIVDAHPAGSRQQCFVNAQKPSESVLNNQFSAVYLVGLFPLLFFGAGIGMLIASARSGVETSGGSALDSSFQAPVAPSGVGAGIPDALELKPATGRRTQAVFLLIFALFWNGVVSVFLFDLIGGFRKGNPDWFLAIFLVPFVLIGVGVIFWFFRSLLFLLAPRLQLTLSPGCLFIGKPSGLSWRFTGGNTQPTRVEIHLEGIEEVRYRSGKSTSTSSSLFYRASVVETTSIMESNSGNVLVQMPPDFPPSFDASNNKIIWRLRVRFVLPMLPDGNEEFPVEVRCFPK